MNIFTKYIFKNLLLTTLLICFAITGIVWLIRVLRLVDLIVNKGLGIFSFFYLSSLLIPSLLLVILPISAFIATLIYYNKMINESELVILESAGVSPLILARPAIYSASVITIICYLISLYILPVSYREFKENSNHVRDNYMSVLLQEGVFNSPMKGLTMYIEENKSGVLKGIFVHDSRQKGKHVIMAKEGRFVNTESGPRLDLTDGNRQEINKKHQLTMLYFDTFSINLSNNADELSLRSMESEEMYVHQLLSPSPNYKKIEPRLISEGHKRLNWPLYSVSLSLIAAITLIYGQYNRRGRAKRIIFGVVTSGLVIGGEMTFNNLVSKMPNLFPLTYVFNLSVLLICLYILSDRFLLKKEKVFSHSA